jgi:poly-beta-1,6-N-acetyl-D-glucosamine synthase
MMEIIFWACFLIIFYTYLGYGIILFLLVKIKKAFFPAKETYLNRNFPNNLEKRGGPSGQQNILLDETAEHELPEVTILVAAYNEADIIDKKIANTFGLEYPRDKIKYIFVTDGSTDGTPEIVMEYPALTLLHKPEREGKINAVNRAMEKVDTPIVVFTDANTLLNSGALKKIVRHFQDENVGAVAGEKRIIVEAKDKASGAGEGIYWKYESALKKWDSELHSVVGAAGELFSIRTSLHDPVPGDTIIEDFFITLRIAAKGYRVIYEPEAYAIEKSSYSVKEELKRKTRIAAGGIQAIVRLAPLLNFFRYGILSFQYISHRVLRWTLAPWSLPIFFIANVALAFQGTLYQVILLLHVIFYFLAVLGGLLAENKIKSKVLFVPFYFFVMNYSAWVGLFRHIKGSQSVIWEKARRS